MNLTPHQVEDLTTYGCFLAGQLLFIMKRTSSAIRNPTKDVYSLWDYLWANKVNIPVRALVEAATLYNLFRHVTVVSFLKLFGIDISGADWVGFLAAVPTSLWSMLALGYFSDSIMDWIGQSKNLPAFLKYLISETLPKVESKSNSLLEPR